MAAGELAETWSFDSRRNAHPSCANCLARLAVRRELEGRGELTPLAQAALAGCIDGQGFDEATLRPSCGAGGESALLEAVAGAVGRSVEANN